MVATVRQRASIERAVNRPCILAQSHLIVKMKLGANGEVETAAVKRRERRRGNGDLWCVGGVVLSLVSVGWVAGRRVGSFGRVGGK